MGDAQERSEPIDAGSEASKPQKRRKAPSERQLAANRKNALLSTGPRSEEGKRRSSRNATAAGYWARQLEPIENGRFAERGEEFWALVEEIIDGFGPRDTLEYLFAKRAAGAIMRLERTDRYEAALLRKASVLDPVSNSLLPDPKDLIEKQSRLRWLIDHIPCAYGGTPPEEDRFWELLAKLLRYNSPDPGKEIEGQWSLLQTPKGEEEWKTAAAAVAQMHWSNDLECLRYFYSCLRDVEAASEAADAARVAAVARDQLDASTGRVDRARTAAWTELLRALKKLEELKSRTLWQGQPPGV